MKKEKEIKSFFDNGSATRNITFKEDPILGYEQNVRQRGVTELLDIREDDILLDVGCGNARDILLFAYKCKYVYGIDFSRGMIKEGLKDIKKKKLTNVSIVIGNAIKLPFNECTFDKISCTEVIEHIPNWEEAIKEMCRCLKNNGRLVITTPNRRSLYSFTKSFRNLAIKLQSKCTHPYDEWKNQNELIRMLTKYGIEVDKKIGICYLPGHSVRVLPKSLKRIVINIINPIENRLRNSMSGSGYIIGITGTKLAHSNSCENRGRSR